MTLEPDGEAPIRVLVADDEPLIREALVDLLQGSGFIVVGVACNGTEAVAIVRSSSPDVVILDVRMPGMGGIEAVRRIRSEAPGIRILILSAYEDRSLQVSAAEAGADGYIVKGTSPKSMIELLRSTGRRAPSVG
jgi:DNA-binding NarL/FixJ family response regulator